METLKKITRIEEIIQLDLIQKQTVCEILQWSDKMYFDFMFQQYEDFLNRMFHGYPVQFINDVKHSSIFSGFWNNEISFRNESDFIPFALLEIHDQVDLNERCDGLVITPALPLGDCYLVDEFMQIHNPQSLLNDDKFMHRYNETLGLIESRKNGKGR